MPSAGGRRALHLLVLATLARRSGCWISVSQALYGVGLDELNIAAASPNEMRNTLGAIWSAPKGTNDDRGLGLSITWSWDPEFCNTVLSKFGSHAFGFQLLDCSSVKTAMHRAFDTWSQNHPGISFIETSDLCAEAGIIGEACPHSEVFVTTRPVGAGTVAAALAIPQYNITDDFVFTNGVRPLLTAAVGSSTTPKRMVEVVGGRIEFAHESPTCWYLDSQFCNVFHRFKRGFANPSQAKLLFALIIFTMWGIAAVIMIVEIVMALRSQLKMRSKGAFVDRDGDGFIEAHEMIMNTVEDVSIRLQAFLAAVAAESIMGTAMRFTILVIPWPFYIGIFQVCWDCFDFEAAATHEIGHLLGLGHPDAVAGSELSLGYIPTNGTFYKRFSNASDYMDPSSCMNPWADVAPGVPPSFPAADLVGSLGPLVRPTVMQSFTAHNPAVCLQQDDYEALVTLYPVCSAIPASPRCEKSDRNLGLMRMGIFISGPLCVALIISIFLHWCVDRQRQKWDAKQKEKEKAKSSRPTSQEGARARDKVLPSRTSSSQTNLAIAPVFMPEEDMLEEFGVSAA